MSCSMAYWTRASLAVTVSMAVSYTHLDYQVKISAKTGEGLDELLNLLESILRSRKVFLERVYPYQEAGKIQLIRKYGQLLKEEYRDDGIFVSAYVAAEMYTNLI